jgi:hypothetical protein
VLRLVTFTLLVVALAACGTDPAGSVDGGPPDAAAAVGQGSPASGDFVVNEVSPKGDGADWIELVNRGAEPIDLCGYFVTDLADRLDHYHPLGGVLPPEPCPPRLLGAGERLVVFADDHAEAGIDHAGFVLGESDEVHLVTTDGQVIDGLLYLYPADGAGRSLARQPDGEGLFFPAEPSAGAANPEPAQ